MIDHPPHPRLQQALAEFGGKIRLWVTQHCQRRVPLDADDIEQEVRIRLWRALESGRIELLTASYVQRVVVNAVIDATRRATVRATEPLDPEQVSQFAEAGQVGVDQNALHAQQVAAVMSAIDELPQRRRIPVKLHLQGFSLQDIAQLQGVTAEGARKLVSRGMDELKQRLQEMGWGAFDD